MNAASFLTSVIEIALATAGFAGIVAAVRQRNVDHWPKEQLIQLQILFTASAASVMFGLLPSFLTEVGLSDDRMWQVSSVTLICWIVGALVFRLRQSKRYGIAMQVPMHIRLWGICSIALQAYNIAVATQAWPYLFGLMTIVMNAFSVFLILVLRRTDTPSATEE
ncbi:MAG: hypothetical protein ACU84Q_03450 [Gammaproteobacteria bacterium]